MCKICTLLFASVKYCVKFIVVLYFAITNLPDFGDRPAAYL